MEALLIPLLVIVVFSTFSPVPAMACFHAAWGAKRKGVPVSPAIVLPAAVFPVVLLIMHGLESVPEWKQYGSSYKPYLALGWSAWVFLPPFAASNFLVARALLTPDHARSNPLTQLSLVSCLLICVLFTLGNRDRGISWVFPASAVCAYGYGLHLLLELHGVPRMLVRYWLLFVAWLTTGVLTVLAAIFQTRNMVAQLPDEAPPDCFIVTAASKGHPKFVGSYVNPETNRRSNRQLNSFRSFEEWLKRNAPKLHQTARQKYNIVGPIIARRISNRWLANLVYLALKPMEWLFRLANETQGNASCRSDANQSQLHG